MSKSPSLTTISCWLGCMLLLLGQYEHLVPTDVHAGGHGFGVAQSLEHKLSLSTGIPQIPIDRWFSGSLPSLSGPCTLNDNEQHTDKVSQVVQMRPSWLIYGFRS
ncbi:hypothetical protein E4T56_gene4084 [Termitomyces sp. T112]|nr:hypothetical protein E4T56_gene4084 [Termitomyces sp. T112]